MQAYDRQRCVMGASRAKDKDAQGAREQARDDGIFAGHAYSILQVRRAGVTGLDHLRDSGRSGVAMVQLRNPWGGHEWKGAWADGSKEWAAHPGVAAHLKQAAGVAADDGAVTKECLMDRFGFTEADLWAAIEAARGRLETTVGGTHCRATGKHSIPRVRDYLAAASAAK